MASRQERNGRTIGSAKFDPSRQPRHSLSCKRDWRSGSALAHTEEVTGSNPVSRTNNPASRNGVLLCSSVFVPQTVKPSRGHNHPRMRYPVTTRTRRTDYGRMYGASAEEYPRPSITTVIGQHANDPAAGTGTWQPKPPSRPARYRATGSQASPAIIRDAASIRTILRRRPPEATASPHHAGCRPDAMGMNTTRRKPRHHQRGQALPTASTNGGEARPAPRRRSHHLERYCRLRGRLVAESRSEPASSTTKPGHRQNAAASKHSTKSRHVSS